MSEAQRQSIIKKGQHNWLDKEYAVAICMALYSKDFNLSNSHEYKVWIYNYHQCAEIFGMSANAMKVMVENFMAFDGKTRLDAKAPKMAEAFQRYKAMPKDQLMQLAIDYIEKTWDLPRRQINVGSYIRSIGKRAFVNHYEIFEKAAKDSDWQETYAEKLPKDWNEQGRNMRVDFSIMLFKCKRQKEALELIVAKSPRLEEEIIEKAKKLLN